ncbi:hypothetical protein [uncultured Brevundimonas sp.]|uniref:hypothetical protein n=1 Tax=uncultured Brevundimonas sp. TaxID=213418 RepID=UPI00259A9DCE|nr:hypothetical protein [uncultured Brevundimonas sp.]
MSRSPKEIIDEAEELLKTAAFGLEDMKTRPGRMKTGLRNAVIFGRNTTWALQNLRSAHQDFEAWYAEKQAEMKADELMKYFHELRNDIEKRAKTPTTTSAHIKSFSSADMARFEPRPPGATEFFIGDQQGGSGWIVKTEGGEEESYYVDLPGDIGKVDIYLSDAPGAAAKQSAADLVEQYLQKIGALVAEARARFT